VTQKDSMSKPDAPAPPKTADDPIEASSRPEVRPLVERAGPPSKRGLPHGTMKTGGDVPGGGATTTRPADPPAKPDRPES
jgi:hypothetical protein